MSQFPQAGSMYGSPLGRSEYRIPAAQGRFGAKNYETTEPVAPVEGVFRTAGVGAGGQAPKGGAIGINGQFYRGGWFLPSSESTDQGAKKKQKAKSTGKQEVAPYVYEVPPAENLRSIYAVAGVGQYTTLKDGRLVLNPVVNWDYFAKQPPATTVDALKSNYQALCDLYNAGERWVKHVMP